MASPKAAKPRCFSAFFSASWRLGARFTTGWRFALPVVGLLLILLMGMTKAAADPQIVESYDYYEIRGKNAAELRQQMNRLGTVWTDGNTYDAFTRWRVTWHYRYREDASGCAIESVATRLNVTYRLPKWIDRDRASANLKRKWNAYIAALKSHEAGHRNYGLAAAREIEATLLQAAPAATCDALGRRAEQTAQGIIDKYAQQEKAYDARTRYGATQGAVFP